MEYELIETKEDLRAFNKEFEQDKNLSAFDSRNNIRAQTFLDENQEAITFAFREQEDLSKLKDWEQENIFRKIDGLPPLAEPVKEQEPRTKTISNNKQRYI